jgi:endo-alpha-1,4-polygalactosaminidase (GH114 family)
LLDIIDRLKTYGLPIIINNGEVFLTRALKERGPQYVTGVNREGVFTDKYYGMHSESDIAFFKTYLSSCKRMGLDVYIIEYGIPQKQILSFAEQNGYHLYFAPDKSKS